MMNVSAKHPDFIPRYAHPGDAGADLVAEHDAIVFPSTRAYIETGVAIELPEGFVGLVMSRSGMAKKNGVFVLNAPGVIDSGYRGIIGVTLYNSSDSTYKVEKGDRIAQLLIQRVERFGFVNVSELNDTARGENGFGSTGTAKMGVSERRQRCACSAYVVSLDCPIESHQLLASEMI